MRVHLDAGTDAGLIALFDPGAVPANFDFDEVYDLAKRGSCLLYAPASDGGFDASIFIDEEPQAGWRQYIGHHIEGAMLRVPTGELWWAGAEYIFTTTAGGSVRPDKPADHLASRCSIPPGIYSVDAFEVNWPEEMEARLLRERTPAVDRFFDKTFGCLAGFGCGSMLLLAVLGPLLLFQLRSIWPWTRGIVAERIVYIVLGYGLLCLVLYGLANAPPAKRMKAARKQIAREYPGTVVVLRRLADDANVTAMHGGIFGDGAEDHFDASGAWREAD